MCQVEQVVRDQFVVGLHVDDAAQRGEARRFVAGEVGNERRVRECRIAWPEPKDAVALHQRPARHFHGLGNVPAVMRVVHASTMRAELHAVVTALHVVANLLAKRKWREAVRAQRTDGHGRTVLLAVQQYLAVADGLLDQPVANFTGPSGHVPSIFQIHRVPLGPVAA